MPFLSKAYFHDEEAAFGYLESVIWQGGPVCPHCGGADRVTKIKANPEKRVRFGLRRCGQCKAQFTSKSGPSSSICACRCIRRYRQVI